jgi:hypothetical protein
MNYTLTRDIKLSACIWIKDGDKTVGSMTGTLLEVNGIDLKPGKSIEARIEFNV